MAGFVDIHHHIVYGMDDGPSSARETEKMLKAAAEDDTERIIATPHVYPGKIPFEHKEYREKLAWINEQCKKEKRKLAVYPGSEIFYTEATVRLLDAGEVPTLAGSRFVLVEFSTDISYDAVFRAVRGLLNAGYAPVIAHIERYLPLMRSAKYYRELKQLPDVKLQMNASTIIKSKGLFSGIICRQLLDEGLIDFVATDAHNVESRKTCMKACYRKLREKYSVAYAEQLTGLNQLEIFSSPL